jgi:carbon monoxide dehydrogenase subunit G
METETRTITAFRELDLRAFGELEITYGDEPALRIEASQATLDRLTTEVHDGCLVIKISALGWLLSPGPVHYWAVTPWPVERVRLSGSGKVRLPDTRSDDFQAVISGSGDVQARAISASAVQLEISGSGNITVDSVQATGIEVKISGSGKVSVDDGAAETLSVRIPGSGRYQGGGVRCGAAQVKIAGSGQAEVWATDRLAVGISGSGAVRYRGQPTVEQHVNGAGKIGPLTE